MQDAVIEYVYGDINEHVNDTSHIMSNVIICPHNRSVKKINEKIVDLLESLEYTIYSSDTATDECLEISEEVLNSFEVPGLPSHELQLEENMPVKLMRNMSRKKKLCNGTRLIVKKLTGSLLYTTNPKTKEEVILPRFELESDIKKLASYSKEGNFQLHLPFL